MAAQSSNPASQSSQAVVVIEGKAYLRDAAGQLTELKPGDQLIEGQILVTDAQGNVKLLLPSGDTVEIGPNRELRVDAELASMPPVGQTEAAVTGVQTITDQILGALEAGVDPTTALEAAAAGLTAGTAAEDGSTFVMLTRIVESVEPLAYSYDTAAAASITPLEEGDVIVPEENENPDAVDDGLDAVNDALTTPEDTALTITPDTLLSNDTDPEGDPLTIISVQDAVNGTVELVDGQVVFTPPADYNGPASFTYTISDGQGGTDTATVFITVTPVNDTPDAVNDGPDAVNDALTTPEDTALTITPDTLLGNDSDPDGDPLTIISVQNPVNGTVELVDGQVVFTPPADYNGPASFPTPSATARAAPIPPRCSSPSRRSMTIRTRSTMARMQ